MPEVLAGTEETSPGLTIGEMISILAEEFGVRADNTRFRSYCVRMLNRAFADLRMEWPLLRRFRNVDAELTVFSGVSDYDVRALPTDGGFGWTNCVEIESIRIPGIVSSHLPLVSLEQYRQRQDYLLDDGIPFGMVAIDPYRIKIFPAPAQDYTGSGDYWQDVPYITDLAARIDWPRGWDSVSLAGAETYISMSMKPEATEGYREKWLSGLASLGAGDRAMRRTRPQRAVVTRNLRQRRRFAYDNSQDLGGR